MVFVVVKRYGGGYACTKGSFDMDTMFDTMNNEMIDKIFSNKMSAFLYAYKKSVRRYVDLCRLHDKPQTYYYPPINQSVDKQDILDTIQGINGDLENIHKHLRELNSSGELFHSYQVVEYEVNDMC